MLNQQPPEKINIKNDQCVEIVSVFYTIQGEGPFAGEPATFIRLAGCNLKCPNCDTEYTSGRGRASISGLVEYASDKSPLVVITGGEPFRQPHALVNLCEALLKAGRTVQIETNGSLPVPTNLNKEVHIVCSPKTGSVHESIRERACGFKYVMNWREVAEDGLPARALGHSTGPAGLARPHIGTKTRVYLQPEDSRNTAENHRNTAAVVKSCLEHGYNLQLQIHKIIGVE